MMRYRPTKRGFTLLETMVSITILALMVLIISRIFSESTRAVERGKSQSLLDDTARLLLNLIEQDIHQALIRTNVAFRVHTVEGSDALYFISTAVRRQLTNIPRDTAPMRLQSARMTDGNRLISIQTPNDPTEHTTFALRGLIKQSDYYYTYSSQTAGDFESIHGAREMDTIRADYTRPLSAGDRHAALTFMDISINADPEWNYANPDGPLELDNMPRFVDVAVGLVGSLDLEQAMRLGLAEGTPRSQAHIDTHERIYTRRIFMRNTGTDQLTF
jgi:prepilin-type N-terminal cleavage/methylation domain-containing protein